MMILIISYIIIIFIIYRYKILCANLETCGAMERCEVEMIHSDFLKLKRDDVRLNKCRLALVDPSCSGGADFDREVIKVSLVASGIFTIDRVKLFNILQNR